MPQPTIPHDPDAEQVILAHCLLTESAAPLGDLGPEYFYSTSNAKVCQAILALAESKQSINFLEIYRHTQANNNGIPADYISGLTDGIPAVKDCEPYRVRLRAKLQERSVLWEANALGRAAEAGESSIQIIDRAEKLAAHAKPETKKDEFRVEECPQLPESAWPPLALEYRNVISQTTEAPDSYHLACFMTLAGAGLGRLVYYQMPEPVYANLFTVLVGLAGEPRKGTAIARAMRLARRARPSIDIMRSLDSAEGMAQRFLDVQKPDLKEWHPVVIRLSELRSLIEKTKKKGLENLIPKLCELYDGDDLEVNTRHGAIRVPDPYGAIIAGTSKVYMAGLRPADLEGGLGSRFAFVPGVAKKRIADPPDPPEPAYGDLANRLKEVFEVWQTRGTTRVVLSDEARALWKPWYEDELPSWTRDDAFMSAMAVRYHHHAIKYALIDAALEHSPVIEIHHLGRAMLWTKFLFESLYYIFSGFGLPPWVEEERKIVAAVKAAGAMGIRRRRLQQKFWKLGSETFERRMKFLCAPEGVLRQAERGKQIWISVNED